MSGWAQGFWIMGFIAVGAVILQVLVTTAGVIRGRLRLQQQQQLQEAYLAERLKLVRRQTRTAEEKLLQWAGWRKFEVIRKQQEDAAGEIFSFCLAPHDGKPIPAYAPGQFLTFQIGIPGQERMAVRCYSMSDCARDDHYRITIKRATPPPDTADAPAGVVSSYLIDHIDVGAILDVMSPKGHFLLDTHSTYPVVMIGGGIGITPMLAMLNAIVEGGGNREAWVYYGVRNSRELIMAEHLKDITKNHPQIRLRLCFSRPQDNEVEGVDYHARGHVNMDLLRSELPSNNYHFFICGPGRMMADITQGLADWGVPPDHVHTETFGPSAGTKVKKVLTESTTGPMVTFRKSGKPIHWNPQAENLWRLAFSNDVTIPGGCLEGNCGSCQTAIISGKIKYFKDPGFECERGTCLVCVCTPDGPVELDA